MLKKVATTAKKTKTAKVLRKVRKKKKTPNNPEPPTTAWDGGSSHSIGCSSSTSSSPPPPAPPLPPPQRLGCAPPPQRLGCAPPPLEPPRPPPIGCARPPPQRVPIPPPPAPPLPQPQRLGCAPPPRRLGCAPPPLEPPRPPPIGCSMPPIAQLTTEPEPVPVPMQMIPCMMMRPQEEPVRPPTPPSPPSPPSPLYIARPLTPPSDLEPISDIACGMRYDWACEMVESMGCDVDISSLDSEVQDLPLMWWETRLKNNTGPVCPSQEFPSLAKLCVKSILDNDVYARDALDTSSSAVLEEAMLRFPFYNLDPPKPVDAWSPHVVQALHVPLAAADPATGPTPCINVNVDLVDSAARIYALATEIDAAGMLADPTVAAHAVSRYGQFLNLVRMQQTGELDPELTLIPALDILAVWFSAIIRTTQYKSPFEVGLFSLAPRMLVDRTGPLIVLDQYGKLLTDDSDHEVAVALDATRAAWLAAYDEPYEVNLAVVYANPASLMSESPHTVTITAADVIRDRNWLAGLHDVVGPDGVAALTSADPKPFLRTLVRSYERFLYLIAKHPDQSKTFISVAYDADLIWHAHQIYPSRYEQDCLRLFGRDIPHVPWPDYTPEQHTANSASLHSAWTDEFPDEPFVHP